MISIISCPKDLYNFCVSKEKDKTKVVGIVVLHR